MKAKKHLYIARVGCEQLRKAVSYKVIHTRRDRAWQKALNIFFNKYPQALERRLTVGGAITLAR
ncbi:MAG: hypothetical protein ACYDDI_01085 [Candidatus Acidiferrales bacterium]